MGSRFAGPIRVGLLTPYFAFFEARFPADFRASQAAYAALLASGLRASGAEVTESGLVDGPEAAAVARERFAAAGVDVVVAAATMAAPPTYGAAALAGFNGPIVIWDDHRAGRYPADVDEVEATRRSGILGSIMLANLLGREGRRYLTVSTVESDATPVVRAIRGAVAAASLRGARLGLLGGIVAGYGDVVLDPAPAAALGIELVEVDRALVDRALMASREPADGPLPWSVEVTEEAEPLLERSRRIERFLAVVVEEARLDALALNCHSDMLRFGEELGAVGCLGASVLWARGVPVACTGDAATAVALMLATRIAGSAQYGEAYAVEHETGEMVISSCGMADPSLCGAGESPRLCANELYPGKHGLGIATRFTFAAGPATVAAFGPGTATLPSRLVVSAGRLTGRGFRHMNGPSGTLTFDVPGPGTATAALIDAGPAHHLALVRGDRTAELRAAAFFLDMDLREVGGFD
jgi:L-fucose isomerase-like protein